MFVLTPSRAAHRLAQPSSVDRLFDESLSRLFGTARVDTRTPAMDVSETEVAYTVAFDVPGVTREQLKVSVLGRRVTLETVDAPKADGAQPAAAPAAVASKLLYRERSTANYARTVSLPVEVDAASAQARFDSGVLTLTLAKKCPTGATQIAIA